MPPLLLALAVLALPAAADDLPLRPSARLLAADPAAFAAGRCAAYREGGSGRLALAPYYVRGEIVGSELRDWHLARCPAIPGKDDLAHYSRGEFVRHALAYPCVGRQTAERDERIGVVRLRVADWETPHEKRYENAGRLYRGMFLDRKLEKDMEIELEADLLGACEP